MKKVLVVTFYFPPHPAVAGLRPLSLARYLPEFGWEAVVLAPPLPGKPDPRFEVIQTRYHDVLGFWKRLLRLDPQAPLVAQVKNKLSVRSERPFLDRILPLVAGIIAYPDPQKGWRTFAVEAGRGILRQQDMKAIISTSPPGTAHIIARTLKDDFGIPWVADFQDLWTQHHGYIYGPLHRALERRLELKTISAADALVTLSRPWADELGGLHKRKDVHTIEYGFDPAEVNVGPAGLTEKFTITYTGNLYPGKQSPEPLFAALRDLIASGSMDAGDVEVRFYGIAAGWVAGLAQRYGLTGIVRQFGIVPRETALERQRESQLLLLLKWNDIRQKGVYTAKVFQYLAARRPILAVGGFPDVVDGLLNKTGAGVSGQTKEDIRSFLLQAYREYRLTGAVSYGGDEAEVNRYSHREIAKQFASILDSITR
jgi:glycosyltransferase involved in cell wall biosynthesis